MLRSLGYRVTLNALMVGALSSWDPNNARVLASLRVSRRYGRLKAGIAVNETIAWSRDIYVFHATCAGHWQRVQRAEHVRRWHFAGDDA